MEDRPATLADLLQLEERLLEHLEKVETTLLTEFHKWAAPADLRIKSHTAALRALDLEVEAHDDRINKLEGNPPSGD
jgi:hypothetical protein